MNPTNNDLLQTLQMEYKTLSDTLEKHGLATYQTLTIGATVSGGLLVVYGSTPWKNGLSGIVLAYGVAIIALGLAFMHSVVLGIGLRLIEVEIRINHATSTPHWNGVCWYSKSIGTSFRSHPGYQQLVILAVALTCAGITFALLNGEPALPANLLLPAWMNWWLVGTPVAVVLLAAVRMVFSEYTARCRRRRLFAEFAVIGA